ncbi:MAG TPA: hypothetical protein VMB70_15230 [Terriglobia bacterium]|nr:hypothetical protein [Terriglobia bacterium]
MQKFLSVLGVFDYAGSDKHLRISHCPMLPSPRNYKVGAQDDLFGAQCPSPLIPLSTLRPTPHDVLRKTRGQSGSLFLTL